jgi:HEAT repeat protein
VASGWGWFTSIVDDDPDTVARQAREAVLAGHLDDADVIAQSLVSPDPDVRARAVGAAARAGRLSIDARLAALNDVAPIVRRRACAIETRLPSKSDRIATALVGLLDDEDPLVVVGAANALAESGAGTHAAALRTTARDHADARCREAAVAALGALGDAASLDVVLLALSDKPAVRRRAVVALSAFRGPRVEAALHEALEDRDWQVREIAAALLSDSPG